MGDIDGMRTSAIAATSLAAITLVGIAVITGLNKDRLSKLLRNIQ